MKITYWKRDPGACGYYRVELPINTLVRNKGYKFFECEKGDGAEKIEKSLESDIFIIPRPNEENVVNILQALKDEGKKVVADHDDNVFCVSPLSPHYADHGTENVKYRMPDGKVVDLWKDGKNINLKKNQKCLDGMKKCMELADMITVTTPVLADVYRQYNDNVKVLPNCIDSKLWQKLPLKKRDDIRIGWAGGHSHYEDWSILVDVLPAIMQKYPNVKLVISGAKFDGTIKKLPQDRIEYHPWVHVMAHPYKQAILDIDIALIPLRDTVFNACKSPIKWIEAGALGIPSVASYVSPYREMDEEDNGIFIEGNEKDGWIEGISYLIENEDKRIDMGRKAKEKVMKEFDINSQYEQWNNAYKEILDGGSRIALAH